MIQNILFKSFFSVVDILIDESNNDESASSSIKRDQGSESQSRNSNLMKTNSNADDPQTTTSKNLLSKGIPLSN